MKTVAVLVPSFAVEYSLEFLAGIYDYFNEKDVRVLVAHSRYYHDSTGAFNYQYWSVINLLKSEEVDVVICASGMYTSTMSRDEIANELKSFLNKPVISVALDFDFEECHSITQRINCDEIFYEIVNHLKTKHGCTNFAFLSANSLNSEEGNERYRAFLNAIKSCDLEFSSENEIEGKFVYEIAKNELKNKYKSKKDIKFDALVAANDAMAIAAMDYFAEIGIDVPEDVKVVGFDDSISSRLVHPRLSTISQNVYGQGYRAAELANDILDGKTVEKNEITELRVIYRQSCGCVDKRNPDPICLDSYGNQSIEKDVVTVKENYADVIRDKVGIIIFMDIVKSSNTLRQLFYDLAYIVHTANFDNMQISFYKEPVYLDSKEDFVVPDCAEIKMFFDSERNVGLFVEDEYFNPRKTLFSEKYLTETCGMHIIQPIFSGEVNYGYIISKIKSKEFVDYGVYLKILINALSQSYD
ncbi:MAG: LacI family DNA-binding transcriptional regulator [Treponema sp.]|nr:LacI family DNA-binding transcriptional regulator [Treponema sp.]